MTFSSGLAADLALLTEALDVEGTDIAVTLAAWVTAASASIPSYVGLSALLRSADSQSELTTVDPDQVPRIRSSLRIPVSAASGLRHEGVHVSLVVYAGAAGALTDLAADIAWLTGTPLAALHLDDDLTTAAHVGGTQSIRASSAIEQAVGVLIGRGTTPEQARAELDRLAATGGLTRLGAASALLATLTDET